MLMEKERNEIVDFGKRMSAAGLSKGTSGNLSCYEPETGYMAISPSGIGYFETTVEDVVIMDLKGKIIEGRRKPSSEHGLHGVIYKLNPEAKGIVHTHSTYCTTFACMNLPIKAVHYAIAGAETDLIPCAAYATYGTPELERELEKVGGKGLAMLLANHGMVAWGNSLAKAFNVAENVEWLSEIQWRAMCVGNSNILSTEEIQKVITSFKAYGQNENKGGY